MKIAIVTTNFPRWNGDFRVPFIIDAAKAIQRHGHRLRIITPHHPGAAEHEIIDSIEVIRIKYLPQKFEVLQKDAAGLPSAWHKSLWNKLATIPYFIALCVATAKNTKNFDIIHANWSLSGLAAFITRPFHHLPYVMTVHGSDIFKTLHNRILRVPTIISLKNADFIIPVSKALSDELQQVGIKNEKFHIIPTGIDISKFPMSESFEREKIILYVGSLIERKGVIFLLRAMQKLKLKFPDYCLLIVGEGELREKLENFVIDNELQESVRFLGTQSQAEVARLMRQAKLFVLPSIEEGQGAVLVEALSSGTPCVGSNIGGIPDVINNDVGKVFEPANIEDLYEKITFMLENDDYWLKASKLGRSLVTQNYSWEKLSKKIISIYEKVLSKN
jgi:glycosyltransferase involved in cell wall biosynthesis